jgi:sRNA-binding protein
MVKLMSITQDKNGILISQKNPEASKPQSQENKKNLHNIKAHQQRLKSIRKATTWLCKTFPDSFNWEQPKPLKRNIQHDIYAALAKVKVEHSNQPSKTLIRNALNYYTGRYAYLKATLSQTHRIDLQGKEAEEICQAHKDYAQALLQQKQAARKKLKEKHKTIEKSKS